jgi:CBS domain containing-hemolysin-like protein
MTREEKNILTNFLKFGDKEVKDVMIHRTEIGSVSVKSTLDELEQGYYCKATYSYNCISR